MQVSTGLFHESGNVCAAREKQLFDETRRRVVTFRGRCPPWKAPPNVAISSQVLWVSRTTENETRP
ncbi:hypothetical protein HSB1_07010 [Halogranum salarium B-1]|uniref:Uncharacterized protein n=1 Tax=Halogranum salarium B-1 TaxID=1210908 RepID=J3A3V9_9EURY|nr:hypothetical protein HSB1_07010 [Halogranum salarium B-1]